MTGLVVTCPATSANLGPGFDVLGLALGLRNTFAFEARASGFEVTAEGPLAASIAAEGQASRVVRAHLEARAALGLPGAAGLRVHASILVPPARGLGSSATAVVAGVLAADAFARRAGLPGLTPARAVEVAAAIEGHPDNVAPCVLGGVCAAVRDEHGRVHVARTLPRRMPGLVVAIPRDLTLETAEMRRVLPEQVSFRDAVWNVGRAALLALALVEGDEDALRAALDDRLHQPHRGAHIPGFDAVRAAAAAAGALGTTISGSGPSLLAWTPPGTSPARVAEAMVSAWRQRGVAADARVLLLDARGAAVEP